MANKVFGKKVIFSLSVLVIVVAAAIILNVSDSPTGAVISETESLAKCLTAKGATMYGAEWCGHCKTQKEMFGQDFKYINYVECTTEREQCTRAGVEGYPTWIINDEQYPGKRSLSELKSLTNC